MWSCASVVAEAGGFRLHLAPYLPLVVRDCITLSGFALHCPGVWGEGVMRPKGRSTHCRPRNSFSLAHWPSESSRGCWEICSQGKSSTLSSGSAWCSALAASYLLWRCWSVVWTACGWAWECWRRPPSRCASPSGLCWGWREQRRSNRWTRLLH